jgi:predicted outer membrane repeat protein
VTTNLDVVADDGKVALREAVTYVNGLTKHPTKLPVVTFAGGLTGATITLDPTKGQLTLDNDIFIDGPVGGITIQRNSGATQKHRIFELNTGYWGKLANLTLRNGLVDSGTGGAGGAILSNSQLTIENCTFSQNEATGTRGGAIAAITGTLSITGGGFTGNSSRLGGAIYIDERVSTSISSSSFVLNTATAYGGGIFIFGSTNATPTSVTLTGVDVNGNTAQDAGGGIYAINGGDAGTTLKLRGGTTVRNNQVLSTSGKGGGVYFGKGTLTLDATGGAVSISSNTAATGPSIYRVNTGTTLTIVGAGNTYVDDTGP